MDLPSIFNVPAAVALLAVAAATLLIFMAASFLGRGKMTTPSSDDTGEDVLRCRQDLGDKEDQGDEEGQEDIFLSHSGRQKNFTEHLYDALKRVNHTVFFDKHSLPIASPFPANIKKALRGCKLGVLVLSEDFLTSKWPMVELGILFKNGIKVLPLFFMLNTEDLKSPKNLSRWRKKWKTMAKNQQQAEQWENAVKELHTINGIVYKHQEGEVAYINKVVTKICNFIRPCPIYDQSNIQGSRALAEEIAGHFDKLDNANQRKRACAVGLHGVGGQGKTTLCKTMVNFFHSKYLGRSSYIEFPTDCDQNKVVEECKKAMKQLFHLGEESLRVDGFDQVVGLMKQHVKELDVFLGIDNIWEHSINDADRLLKVGFSANSKVLLTSRSKGVLQTLLSGCAVTGDYYHHLDPLPAPDDEDAFQIFQQSVKHDGFFPSLLRNQIKDVLHRCRCDGKYHPLALKALGAYASRLCGLGNFKRSRPDWTGVLGKLQNADLHGVDAVIRLNYESLDEVQQHIFLDIALCLTTLEAFSEGLNV